MAFRMEPRKAAELGGLLPKGAGDLPTMPMEAETTSHFRMHLRCLGRARGDNAAVSAAHHAGIHIWDQRRQVMVGTLHELTDTFMVAPQDAPAWALDPRTLWQAVEQAEVRIDASLCREVLLDFDPELDYPDVRVVLEKFAGSLVDRFGVALQVSMMRPEYNSERTAATIMMTSRKMSKDGMGEKVRAMDVGSGGRTNVRWMREELASLIHAHLGVAPLPSGADPIKEEAFQALLEGNITRAAMLAQRYKQIAGHEKQGKQAGTSICETTANHKIVPLKYKKTKVRKTDAPRRTD